MKMDKYLIRQPRGQQEEKKKKTKSKQMKQSTIESLQVNTV